MSDNDLDNLDDIAIQMERHGNERDVRGRKRGSGFNKANRMPLWRRQLRGFKATRSHHKGERK